MSRGGSNVAVVGATGLVGEEILTLLVERAFPFSSLRTVASEDSAGGYAPFGDRQLKIERMEDGAIEDADLVFLAAGSEVSGGVARRAVERGSTVIDTSTRFLDDEDAVLVVPEVNAEEIEAGGAPGLFVAAGGTTAAVAPVIKPLDGAAGVVSMSVSTYEPVSGIGEAGVSELSKQTLNLFNSQEIEFESFAQQIAFNCIPAVGDLDASGDSTAERNLVRGIRRVLNRPELFITATAVCVPTFFGHGAAVTVELSRPLAASDAAAVLRSAPGLLVAEGDVDPYATPLEVVGSDAVHVGRLRVDSDRPALLSFWVVIGNVRKVAVNAVSIAERTLRDVG